jgi:hypothetical protein
VPRNFQRHSLGKKENPKPQRILLGGDSNSILHEYKSKSHRYTDQISPQEFEAEFIYHSSSICLGRA